MIDANQIFDGSQSAAGVWTGAALTVTRDSTNVIDFSVRRDIGAGNGPHPQIHVNVGTAFTAGGAATLVIELKGSLTAGGTYYSIIQSPTYAVADLIAGKPIFRYSWPVYQLNEPIGLPMEFYKLVYTVATGPMLTGTVSAFLTGYGDRNVTNIYSNNYVAA